MNKKIYYILTAFICIFFNINAVKATTCTYEMYPIGIDDSLTARTKSNITGNSLIMIDTSKKKEVTSVTKFGKTENKNFSENSLSKYIKKHGCPPYIKRDGSGDLDKLSDSKFKDYLSSFYDKNSSHYPLVLVNNNGEATSKYATTVLSYATSKWTSLKNKGELNADQKNVENLFINSVKKSTVYDSVISKSNTWKSYIKAEDNKKELEKKSGQLETAKSDYCYFYCDNKCSSYSDSNAINSCKNTCAATEKSKCTEAYNACSSENYSEECIKTKLEEKGLDSSYASTRESSLNNLQNDVNSLNNTVQGKTAINNLNINFNSYKLKCDDVVFLHKYWFAIQIIAPILVILFGTVDFLVSVVSSNEEKIIKARGKFPKRLVAGFLIFLAASIVSIIVNVSTDESARDDSLMYCIINGK